MKKIYLTLGLGALILGAQAQQTIIKTTALKIAENTPTFNYVASPAVTNTLTPPTFTAGGCATNSANIAYYSTAQYTATPTYTIDSRGYMFGTNTETQTQTAGSITIDYTMSAQKYSITGTANITDVVVYGTKVKSDAATSLITAAIFTEDPTTKAPLIQTGASGTKALNSFIAGPNVIHLASPVPVSTGNFFATIQSPVIGGATHDTLAILSTKVGCSTTDSLSWRMASYNSGAFTEWISIKHDFGVNLDILIFPVIDITTGINNSVSKGNLTLLAAFPNPATNELSINFGLNQTSKVEIEMYDVTGKIVNTIKLDNLEAGNHSSKVNISNLNAGVYMYSVKTENAKMFSKFTVVK